MRAPTSVILASILIVGLVVIFSSFMAVDQHMQDVSLTGSKPSRTVFTLARSFLQNVKNKTISIPGELRNFRFEKFANITKRMIVNENYDFNSNLSVLLTDKIFHPMKRHPAAPDPQYMAKPLQKPLSCNRSFEPTCDMYPYVRFWNKRFTETDCYKSPLRHPLGAQAPYHEQKYLVFEPDNGGWNNIRMAAETAMVFAHATGRTLVMPPTTVWYLLNKVHI